MKPRLLNLAAAVSLLLAVAILFLWVRCHGRSEAISRRWHTATEWHGWTAQSRYASLSFAIARQADRGRPFPARYEYSDNTLAQYTAPGHHIWFRFPPILSRRLSKPPDAVDLYEITLAYWLLFLPTLVLPAIAFIGRRQRRQREAGNLCPNCGYDLRAHNAGDRCPECGMVPASGAVSPIA